VTKGKNQLRQSISISVGVAGFGYWGPNLVRNFADNDRMTVTAICDTADERLASARRHYPNVALTKNFAELCNRTDVDLVVIATPARTHYALAKMAMESGKDVFVEKPLCTSIAEALELASIARQATRRVFVDHTFVYNPAVRAMAQLVRNESFGRPLYYDSVRTNLGLFRSDINVLWDLAPHDLSILAFILNDAIPHTVSCIGRAHFQSTEHIAYLTLLYDGDFIAHCHLNWLAPVKIRQVLFGGTEQMLMYDDTNLVERVRLYDKGVTFPAMLGTDDTPDGLRHVQYRVGDIRAPFIESTESLKIEVEHIASSYFDGEPALTGIDAGVNMVRILDAASRSMRDGGLPVRL